MSLFQSISDAFWTLLHPWIFMSISASHIPSTIHTLIRANAWFALFSPSAFSEALFGQFWATVGPQVKEGAETTVIPLLEGRVVEGRVVEERVGEPVGGVVMEVGAGSGMWADVFKKIRTAGDDGSEAIAVGDVKRRSTRQSARNAAPAQGLITKIYGIEPNPQSYTALRQRVKDIGLSDVYEVVPVGIEDITNPSAWAGKIEPGSVDCVVSVLCLCSIPDQEKNVRHLYDLLKPGGRWYVYEHVKATRGGLPMRLYQRFVNVFWSFFVGSCRVCQPTETVLRNTGPWSKIDLAQPVSQPSPFQVLPHILGTLTK
ncbi:methyltransferase domain-containing protein [Sarocladium implicatum]|nr:methyltransferase domain-containing protein [Sarocladium implicatum]